MSYIAFDLDALNAVPHVARASAIDEARITHGLVHLWAHCFRAKVDHITRIHLLGFFGADVADALEAFGFLEKDGTSYRVKGASRYLRIATGRSEGGKKSAGNLIPGARQKKAAAESVERWSREPLSAASRLPLGSVSAPSRLALGLSPTTDDRRPTTECKEEEAPPVSSAAPVQVSFVPASPVGALGVALSTVFAEERDGATGPRSSPTAERALLKLGDDAEILRRWRIGLRRTGYPTCSGLADLVKHWDAYAAGPAGAKGDPRKGAFRAEDVDKSAFAEVGVMRGF